jgi:tetratricopeptide (TPR) repeat protein
MSKAIADYSAVINMPDVSAEQRAQALVNRGVQWGESGDTSKEIADYSAVVDIPDAPSEQKAKALVNRGVRWAKSGDTSKAIADYTAVIKMPDAPAKPKAIAFVGRGWTRFADLDDVPSMIDDSRRALALDKDNLDARSNLALGLLLSRQPEPALKEYESLLSNASDNAPIQIAVKDIEAALRKKPDIPEAASILDLLRARLARD